MTAPPRSISPTMDEEPTQIAWTAIEKGTTVVARDGSELGKISTVVADETKDIFSGIVLRSGLFDPQRFVPADLIDEITPEQVRVRLNPEEAEKLEPYES